VPQFSNSVFPAARADFREIEALRKKHAGIEALCSAQLLETKELIRREFPWRRC
jgi:hypothetical protein